MVQKLIPIKAQSKTPSTATLMGTSEFRNFWKPPNDLRNNAAQVAAAQLNVAWRVEADFYKSRDTAGSIHGVLVGS